MSATMGDALRIQHAARDLDRERRNDALQVERIVAQTETVIAAVAYDHASHGCPNGWPDVPCPVCEPAESGELFI